jgi:hypothetical protein
LQIPIEERSVKKHNPLVTEYYFDLVLLYGDATKDDRLKVESDTSSFIPAQPLKKALAHFPSACPKQKNPG